MSDQTMSRVIKADASANVGRPTGVLNLTDIAASARAIVSDARKQAAKIVADARLHTEQLQHSAMRKAHAEGFAAGQSEGYSQGKRQALAEAEALHQADSSELAHLAKTMIDELSGARKEVLDQARREMLSFAVALAGKIVGCAAAKNSAVAKCNLERALNLAQGRTILSVRCNPQQVEKLKTYCQELMGDSSAANCRFVADDSLSPGGLKVVCDDGQIDATVQTQWHNVISALLGEDAAPVGATDEGRGSEEIL